SLPPTAVPPFLDVNGDGFINALDVLAVIDEINKNLSGGRGGEGEASDLSDLWVPAVALEARTTESIVSNSASRSAVSGSIKSASRTSDMVMASYFGSSLATGSLAGSDDLLDWAARSVSDSYESDDRLDIALSQELDDILGL
ncbi:MAG: dockerin type I domain-containing protein, partial [Planctomycetota bacterium]